MVNAANRLIELPQSWDGVDARERLRLLDRGLDGGGGRLERRALRRLQQLRRHRAKFLDALLPCEAAMNFLAHFAQRL
jgi:hypothetical protein